MNGKNKIKIVLSLLIAISFLLTSSTVMATPNLSKETVKTDSSNRSAGKATLGYTSLAGSSSPLLSLQDGPWPVGITAISINGIDHVNDDIIASGTYPLDVTVCKLLQDPLPATVKKFIEVFKKIIIPGTPGNVKDLYCEDFEDPCEIALNWSTIDMPVWGYNGALDTWTWSAKRSVSPGHSMHSTSFDQYLPNQWDILELGFNAAGLDVSAYDSINITWKQFVDGDMQGGFIQDYGYFEYSWDDIAWTQKGVNYYDSGGAWQTINLNIPVTGTTLFFRWVWKSDPLFCYEGWYIDDVCLKGIIEGTPDVTTWVFVMDSYSYPQVIEDICETYVFNESWIATEGEYRICAWLQTLDPDHESETEYASPYCIYITIGNILDLALDCNTLTITPDSPAWEGDNVTVCVNVSNIGTLNAEDVQIQLNPQYGSYAITGYDSMERQNNGTTGLLPGRLLAGTDLQWVRATSGAYPWGTMAGNTRSYAHYTTYDSTEGTKSLANFQEYGGKPWYYWNYESVDDYVRGPLLWEPADKDLGISAKVDLTYSIGAGDKLDFGIWDYSGSGYSYGWTWNGPAYVDWTTYELKISDWIKALQSHVTPTSQYCIYVFHTKSALYPASIDNQNPANPRNNEWSGWMMDNIVYSKLVPDPKIQFTQTINIPHLNITDGPQTVCFTIPNITVGRHVFTVAILNADADASNNKCIRGYEVMNTMICADDLTCVDYTGPGQGHWVEESCCGGYFWAGDPSTTMYGNNWDDCLYLRNATGGLTFDMSAYADACLDFSTWFQMMDLGDFGVVQYSDDAGLHWYNLTTYTMNSTDLIWGADIFGWFDESLCVGYTTAAMQFRFLFVSNDTGVNRGWLVDNIALTGDGNYVFGPDPTLTFTNFYRHEQQFRCWWQTPDIFGYTPGWSNFDPTYLTTPGLYPGYQDDAIIWTLDIPHVFYGCIDGINFYDTELTDYMTMDVSNNNGITWKNLDKVSGSPNDDYAYPPLTYQYTSSGPWSLEDYIDNQVLIRWRFVSDATNAHAYIGAGWEDFCFYGMEDNNPPVTTMQMSGTFVEEYHWYTSCVKIKLNATDDLTGVAHTYYKLDGVTSEYTGVVTICTDGTHTFCYWSVDKEGNVEAEKCIPSFRIDLSGPTVSITGPATGYLFLFGSQILPLKSGKTLFFFGGIPVTATATANEAPIQVVRFYLDDVLLAEDSSAPYAATLSAKHSGAAVIKVTARDVLGHEASATLNIDNYFEIF